LVTEGMRLVWPDDVLPAELLAGKEDADVASP
jgi:hypothetical protein